MDVRTGDCSGPTLACGLRRVGVTLTAGQTVDVVLDSASGSDEAYQLNID